MAAVDHAASLHDVSAEAGPYQTDLLPTGGTGLCLFAAGFLGINDAIHMWRAGMSGDLIDTDGERLDEMGVIYDPMRWNVRNADAWRWSEEVANLGYQWDVVSVDSFTGDIEPRVLASLPLWCSLARSLVTVTLGRGQDYRVPDGWQEDTMRRSALASWLVLTRV